MDFMQIHTFLLNRRLGSIRLTEFDLQYKNKIEDNHQSGNNVVILKLLFEDYCKSYYKHVLFIYKAFWNFYKHF